MLLAVEKVEDVRAHIGTLLARKAGAAAGNNVFTSLVNSFTSGSSAGGGVRR